MKHKGGNIKSIFYFQEVVSIKNSELSHVKLSLSFENTDNSRPKRIFLAKKHTKNNRPRESQVPIK